MTFSTTTLQGKIVWLEMSQTEGKNKDKTALKLLVSVPDKRSKEEVKNTETGEITIEYKNEFLYSVRIWGNQSTVAHKYLDVYQTITLQGQMTGVYLTKGKEKNGKVYAPQYITSLDFANIISYGPKQPPKEVKEGKELAEVAQ